MDRYLRQFLRKATAIALATAMMSQPVWAVTITGFDTAFTTNFNGWNGTLPTGFGMSGNGATYRGDSATATTGGVYAVANSGFGWRASSSATTLSLTGTFENSSGSLIEGITLSYDAFQITAASSRTPGWTVTSSLGTVSDLNWAFNSGNSPASPAQPTLTLTGLSIDPGATFTFTFASDRGAGSGSSPLIGLNNISVTATGGGAPEVFTSWNGSASGGTWQNGAAGQFGGNYANDLTNTVSFVGSGVTVTTAGTPQAGSLAFGSTGYTLAGTGLQLGIGDIEVANAAHAATISAALAGTAITKSGAGRLVLSGNNTFTGATTVSSGVLEVRSANALGTPGNGTTVSAGASLALAGNVTTAAEPLSLNGTGSGNAGALVNLEGSNTFAGPVTLATDSSIVAAVGSLTLTGGVAGAGRTLSVGGPGNVSVATTGLNMGAGGQLVKAGPGTLTVSAAGDFAGGTTITSGAVRAGVAGGLGSGAVSLQGGSLYGTDGVTTANAITVAGGETVIAYWDFNGINTSAPSFAASHGTGSISMAGWGGSVGSFTGSALNALTGVAAGNDLALQTGASDAGNGTFIQIGGFSMAGFTDLVVSFATRGTSTGFDNGQWSYSVDGETFIDFGTNTASRSDYAVATPGPTSGVNDLPSPVLRYTLSGGAGTSSNNRIDNLRLTANAVPMLGTEITSGTTTFSGAVALNSDVRLTAEAGGAALFSGIVSGSGGIDKVGAGTVTLSGSNTFSGGTTVNAGTLSVSADANLGGSSGGITLGGGTLEFTSGFELGSGRTITATADTTSTLAVTAGTVSYGGAFTGSGNLDKAGAGRLVVSNASSGYSGLFTISAGTLEVTGSNAFANATLSQMGGTLLLAPAGGGDVVIPDLAGGGETTIVEGATAVVGGPGNSSYNGRVRGQGGLRKEGAGDLLLNGDNDFSGPTRIAAGRLKLGPNGALSETPLIEIDSNAIFDVVEKTGGFSLALGQRLGGRGTILGDLEFGSGSEFAFDPSGPMLVGSGTISFASGFGIGNIFGLTSSVAEGTFTLLNETTGGNINFANLANVGPGNPFDLGDGKSAYFQEGSLQVVVVPEPPAVVLGGLGLAFAAWAARRRQRAAAA